MTEVDAELLAMIRARVGQTVCGGKYSIEGVLGIGGMAAVYAGLHRNGRRVAMKLLHPEFSRRPDIRKRFQREGQAANRVEHRSVVAVIDDDVTEDGSAFLVMERLEGKSLEQLWEEVGRRLPVRAVLAIARELCDVLGVAHRVGIVHRDIKPENLFLTNEGQLKVLDFGLAQLRDAARPKETYTGMVFGTPAFMPPEQASGQTSQIDARTDIWAVGATMFTLLSGELVHRGETAQHFVMLSAMEPARSLAAAMPHAHPALVDLVDRALARSKELRWQSADAMREAIVEASESLVGDADIPMMTPTALAEWAAARAQHGDRAKPASRMDREETTQRRNVPPTIEAINEESSSDQTEIRAPEALGLERSDAPTEPRAPRVPSGGAGDTPTEQSTPDELPTQVRQPIDRMLAESHQAQRSSSRDLRKAIESTHQDDTLTIRDETALLQPVRVADQTALLPPRFTPPSSQKLLQASSPPTPGERGSESPAIPLRGPRQHATTAKVPTRPSLRSPQIPIAVAAAFIGLLPLAYFLPRQCGAAPAADTTTSSTIVVPLEMTTAPTRATASSVASVENGNVLQAHASAAPSTLPPRPNDSTAIVPDPPYKSSAPALPPNPYAPDVAGLAPSSRPTTSAPASPKAVTSGVTQPNRRSNCTPPYVVDANGKLHWKEECLSNSKPLPREEKATSERQ